MITFLICLMIVIAWLGIGMYRLSAILSGLVGLHDNSKWYDAILLAPIIAGVWIVHKVKGR